MDRSLLVDIVHIRIVKILGGEYMKSYVERIKNLPLFKGIEEEELDHMLTCLGGYNKTYKKGEIIFLPTGEKRWIGLILNGTVQKNKEDLWGNKTGLGFMKDGELFGETFACGDISNGSVAFYAAEDCKVFFIPFHKVLTHCPKDCNFRHRLIENMVVLIASKNAQLMEKVEVVSKKSLREKILSYLSLQAQNHHNVYFEIPIGRVELADYLCANRSEIGRAHV